ncbi:MAG: hypothetical protein ACK59B_03915 [Alphaproteobacteria bacterium]|jgi:hypothetical protein
MWFFLSRGELLDRTAQLEGAVADLNREVASLRVEIAGIISRQNATVSFYEQRVDLIYKRVVQEFMRLNDDGRLKIERTVDSEQKLLKLLSGGLEGAIDMSTLNLRDVVSDVMSEGEIKGPLTLYGFRLNRGLARERGGDVLINAGGRGIALYGPYKRLSPGRYIASVNLSVGAVGGSSPSGEVEIDIFSSAVDSVVSRSCVEAFNLVNRLELAFDWGPRHAGGTIEIRLHQRSNLTLHVSSLRLERDGSTA